MNDEAVMTNDEKMRNEMCESLGRYSAPSYLPFNDLTIQCFNVTKP
jgi:hypothetical protein